MSPTRVEPKLTWVENGPSRPATGVTEPVGVDVWPVPKALVALTVNVYGTPATRSEIETLSCEPGVGDADDPVGPAGTTTAAGGGASTEYGKTVKLEIDDPLSAGTVHCTVTVVPDTGALTPPGAYGGTGEESGVTELVGDDAGPVPDALSAATLNETLCPLARPVTSYWSVAPGVGSSAVPGVPAATSIDARGLPLAVGVITNVLMGWPPSAPTVHITCAPSKPAMAPTPEGADGADGVVADAGAGGPAATATPTESRATAPAVTSRADRHPARRPRDGPSGSVASGPCWWRIRPSWSITSCTEVSAGRLAPTYATDGVSATPQRGQAGAKSRPTAASDQLHPVSPPGPRHSRNFPATVGPPGLSGLVTRPGGTGARLGPKRELGGTGLRGRLAGADRRPDPGNAGGGRD